MQSSLSRSLVNDLRAGADPLQAEAMRRYFRTSRLGFLGVKHPHIRRIAANYARRVPQGSFPTFLEELWSHEIFEIRRAAVEALLIFVQRGMTSRIAVRAISQMLEDVDTWALVDPMAWSVSKLLQKDPGIDDTLREWSTSGSVWRRRMSVVPFADICMKGQYRPEYVPRMLKALEPHLEDEEFFVAKAVGWVLRELGKHEPETARAFIDGNAGRLSKLAKREGSKRLRS